MCRSATLHLSHNPLGLAHFRQIYSVIFTIIYRQWLAGRILRSQISGGLHFVLMTSWIAGIFLLPQKSVPENFCLKSSHPPLKGIPQERIATNK